MNSHPTEANKGNILIVDDTPENLQVLSATLSDRGYKVRGVVNGKMALRAARSAPPDLILLDIRMPDLSGYEVCEQLKADPQSSKIPVIFISALDEVLDKVKAFQVGCVDYITKPFQVEEVLARVEHQLTIQSLQKQLIAQNEQLQQEILERKRAEEAAEAASEAKSQFLANMSHELRTPLNAILGFTQVMSRDAFLSSEQVEYLRIINRSGEHLLELINDVLDLSKIEAGIISLSESSFDLYRLLDNLEEMFQHLAEKKGLKLRIVIQPDVPPNIKADEKKLRICLINLLGNALKFTFKGGVTLRVSQQKIETELGVVRQDLDDKSSPDRNYDCVLLFEVEDTGVGISLSEIPSLFDAFVQTESGRKSAEGTGLGLTITQKFVQMMGGEITVNSFVDKGTTFKFNIQVKIANASEVSAKISRRVVGLEPHQETFRILAVDDNRDNRLLLLKLLQPIGFEVKEAENGEEALTLWETWQPHLIWLDTRMPILDGLEATKQIRSREKGRQIGTWKSNAEAESVNPKTMPESSTFQNLGMGNPNSLRGPTIIIALTASAFEEKRDEILAVGCDDFVRKPFQEQLIFDKIAHFLGVRYIYEELSPLTGTNPSKHYPVQEKPDSFFLPLLAELPQDWIWQLYEAANEVNEDSILRLIEQLPETSASLAEALKDLLHDFRLDKILRLTQAFIEPIADKPDGKQGY